MRLLSACVIATLAAAGTAGAPSREPLRPLWHFTPPRYFMNDPNGLVFYKGEYHLFYQHNPVGETWGHMSWGHAVSRDMLRWEHLPVALREEQGVMIFSGSVVVDRDNSSGFCKAEGADRSCLVAIYTGHGHGRQTQNLAYSNDRGRTWTKYERNPVIDLELKDFRDPKVIWHEPTGRWVMVTVLSDQHKVRFFGSRDLKAWTALSDFGPAGATGGVWECPDLFALAVDGNDSRLRWVLDVDINPGGIAGGSGGQYFVGWFDGTRFVNDNAPATTLWADYGADFYATISFAGLPSTDPRTIWMAWISNWLYANEEPTVTWRGAQSVPRQLSLRTLPDGVRLVQTPIREVETLRQSSTPDVVKGTAPIAGPMEIRLAMPQGNWREVSVRLANGQGESVSIGMTSKPLEVFVDRRASRRTPFHAAYPARHSAPIRWRDGAVSLRVLFDVSVVEVFANDGEASITDRVYPAQPFDRLELTPSTLEARVWTLKPAMAP